MKLREICQFLESMAPLDFQESYDNAGLIIGEKSWEVTGAIISLDATLEVLKEAKEKGCNLVISHHPIVFKGLKKINRNNYVERVVWYAIQNEIALYACHTNLDNVLQNGVNGRIAEKLQLHNCRILQHKVNMSRIMVDADEDVAGDLENWANTQDRAYDTFRRKKGLSISGPKSMISQLENRCDDLGLFYLTHDLNNKNPNCGSGMIGELMEPLSGADFLSYLKTNMNVHCIRHTAHVDRKISKVAICGGAGSFLTTIAKRNGADAYVSGDFKYHEFFDADGTVLICDIGHYESEQFTIDLMHDLLMKKFTNFAAYKTKADTNPIKYF